MSPYKCIIPESNDLGDTGLVAGVVDWATYSAVFTPVADMFVQASEHHKGETHLGIGLDEAAYLTQTSFCFPNNPSCVL